MEPLLARKMWATLEPVHAMVYFAPEAFEAWERLGFPHHGMGYFASRSAAMGRVGAAVVSASFYNFHPGLVARFIPAAWDHASPEDIIEARFDAVDTALRRFLGYAVASAEMADAADTAMEAAAACPPGGRPLFAAHADLLAPESAHLRLWHALTLLREFRGDGHVQALVSAGMSATGALASYAATGEAFEAEFYRRSRGWSEEDWAGAVEDLRQRKWLDGEGRLTDEGRAGREAIEVATDRLAAAPWAAIGEAAADRLRATVRPWSRGIVAQGGLTPYAGDAENLYGVPR
ncbi:MAG: hypothetical protein M3349_08405 [Actinomycetota bacterium]|nr:hypothetical protein [Actinomycetota bacterium]